MPTACCRLAFHLKNLCCHTLALLLLLMTFGGARAETVPSATPNATQVVASTADHHTWLLIDSATATLSLMRGDKVLARYGDVAFGRLGTKPVHYKGDTSTPTGEFRIDGINHASQFHRFFSLNYPTEAHAKKALDQRRITFEQYMEILKAEHAGRRPPYDTPLGGMIGIHGLGPVRLDLHRKYNWTRGCVALDNGQIDALTPHLYIGMRVVIR